MCLLVLSRPVVSNILARNTSPAPSLRHPYPGLRWSCFSLKLFPKTACTLVILGQLP